MPEKGKLFDFKKSETGLKSVTTYDASNDYAVIISGGFDDENNWIRYWNDCSAMYSALVDVYDYLPSHIYVIMSDGTSSGLDRVLSVTYDSWGNPIYTRDSSPLDLDGNGTNDIQYSATKSNISTVFNTLSNILDEDDHLFVFTTDHGGHSSGNDVYLYLWGETMTDDEFATELDKVDAGKITVTMEQCNSGGFIDDLSENGRIISTACLAAEESYALANLTYNEYVYHWISAVAGETPEGTTVDADYTNDGWVSMREAFEYANTHDTRPEHPQYNSTPSGLGCLVRLSDNWNWSITGPSLVCTSGGTFTLHDRPSGTSVTWSKSGNLSYISGQGTDSYKVKASGAYTSGEGWVRANIISSVCQDTVEVNKDIWAGIPDNDRLVTGVTWPAPGPYAQVHELCNQGTTEAAVGYDENGLGAQAGGSSYYDFQEYQWYIPSGNWTVTDTWQGDPMEIVNISPAWGYQPQVGSHEEIRVRGRNGCGWSGWHSDTWTVVNCGGGGWSFSMQPNPANETVEIKAEKDERVKDASATYEVRLYTALKREVYASGETKAPTLRIPVRHLKDGIYFIRFIAGKQTVVKQLVVKH